MRQTSHREISLFSEGGGCIVKAFSHKVVSNEQQQLFLREGDPRLSYHTGPLQPCQRHIRSNQQRFARDPFYQLSCELTKLHVLAAFVLEHRLLHELLDVSAAEQRQFADDLSDGAGARKSDQSLTGQSSNLICICNRHLHCQQGQQHLQDTCRI